MSVRACPIQFELAENPIIHMVVFTPTFKHLSAMLNRLKALGPGLLYAGAAIGVSHIVQSTRAGAEYGYVLIIGVILVHVLKYPFFTVGPRFTHYSGKTLVSGFASLNKWALPLLLVVTLATMFFTQAAVTMVTAGLAYKLTGISWSPAIWSAVLLAICSLILFIGKFNVLDNLMKVIMVVLAISTILAMSFSFEVQPSTYPELMKEFNLFNAVDMAFLIAFLGWMPAPLDITIWQSIWTRSKMQQVQISRKDLNFDFRVGFYGTAGLAICFIILGANTLYGTGVGLQPKAGAFAAQLVDIYTTSLGQWSYPIIIVAAFTTMFSTTLTCLDALPAVMAEISKEYRWESLKSKGLWMVLLIIGALGILFFVKDMKQMVTLSTVISFLTAPIIALLTYRLVKKMSDETRLWAKWETYIAIIGLLFLSILGIYYLYTLL